jgi:hypothetical protein
MSRDLSKEGEQPEDAMTENGKELEELRRAHAALESRVETILPTLATKADVEAMGARISERMDDGFRRVQQSFIHIWTWIAGSMLLILLAIAGLFGAVLTRNPTPAPASVTAPAVAYHFHESVAPPAPVAPAPQP